MRETLELVTDIFRLVVWTARRLSEGDDDRLTPRGVMRCAGGVVWMLYLAAKMRLRPY